MRTPRAAFSPEGCVSDEPISLRYPPTGGERGAGGASSSSPPPRVRSPPRQSIDHRPFVVPDLSTKCRF